MTARCSDCGINYPYGERKCRVCEGNLSMFKDASPDEDWQEEVARRTAPLVDSGDPVVKWRHDQLVRAGCTPIEAALISSTKVDLHKAVTVVTQAGPARALEILL